MSIRLHIKVCEARNVLKMDVKGKSDPYVTLRLKSQDKKDFQKTQIISNNNNPVWNQEFDIVASDPNDMLLINMYDEDLKNDDKMMDELQYPVHSWQVGGPIIRKEIDIKLKKKDAGKLIFEVQAFPGQGYASGISTRVVNLGVANGNSGAGIQSRNNQSSGIQSRNVQSRDVQLGQPCKVVVHAVKGEKLKKQDSVTTDPYLTLQLKNEPETIKRTRTIGNDLNPVWNQSYEFHSKDWNNDELIVNMMNEKNNGEKMMNELHLPIRQWPIGSHIDYQEDVSLKKKNAGRLYLGIDVLNEDPKQPKQRHTELKPVQKPTPAPEPEPETETYEETRSEDEHPPLSETENEEPTLTETENEEPTLTETETKTVQSRDATLDEPSNSYCDFSWGNEDSRYSTDFTGFTENSSTLSAVKPSDYYHHHHKLHPEAN